MQTYIREGEIWLSRLSCAAAHPYFNSPLETTTSFHAPKGSVIVLPTNAVMRVVGCVFRKSEKPVVKIKKDQSGGSAALQRIGRFTLYCCNIQQ